MLSQLHGHILKFLRCTAQFVLELQGRLHGSNRLAEYAHVRSSAEFVWRRARRSLRIARVSSRLRRTVARVAVTSFRRIAVRTANAASSSPTRCSQHVRTSSPTLIPAFLASLLLCAANPGRRVLSEPAVWLFSSSLPRRYTHEHKYAHVFDPIALLIPGQQPENQLRLRRLAPSTFPKSSVPTAKRCPLPR